MSCGYTGNVVNTGTSKSYLEASYGQANLAYTITNEKIWRTGLNGYSANYPAKFNGTITQFWLSFDNTDNNYTNWYNGTLQLRILVNGIKQYTGPIYNKATFNSAITYSNNDIKIINYDISIPVVVGDLISMTYSTVTFLPGNTADIMANLIIENE